MDGKRQNTRLIWPRGMIEMKKVLAALGAAALTLGASATGAFAGYMQPGETMGVSLVSPLPEGVYFADLEDYGRSPNLVPGTNAINFVVSK